MPKITVRERTFDARPDRIDLRDREYQPRLASLPDVYPSPEFIEQNLATYPGHMILDQGSEGACTGFGLAATINFLLWQKQGFQEPEQVSPRMLYHLARVYDEWPGEDYSGSSCRGAMRGWHRHGACSEALWPYRDKRGKVKFIEPSNGWDTDAAKRPLGAYYRVNKDSIADMQAAICEVGAIYVSAQVHEGWFLGKTKQPVIIDFPRKNTGGHAFAIGGYNADGFLVQNSWGPDWGFNGFAFLSYDDWVKNGADAWVAVLGAPVRSARSSVTFSTASSSDASFGKSTLMGKGAELNATFDYKNPDVRPQTEEWAYQHCLVLGNNGMPVNKLVATESVGAAADIICRQMPADYFRENRQSTPRIALYVHGGLNSESDSIRRIRVMGPYFKANGIYPLFVTWRTGAVESFEGIVADSLANVFSAESGTPEQSIVDSVKDKLEEARDRTIEVACESLLVKPLWSEMKQNAEAACEAGGGLRLLIDRLAALEREFEELEIHLIGHSAGSIVLGHVLSSLKRNMQVRTISLYAPACTLDFALRHYARAAEKGVFEVQNLHVDNMDDERERADNVGPYGKSLLYLVSRALESRHKTPLLGLNLAWRGVEQESQDHWHDDKPTRNALEDWKQFADSGVKVRWHDRKRKYVWTGIRQIRLAHGSFDNDIEVVQKTLQRIRRSRLLVPVECLDY